MAVLVLMVSLFSNGREENSGRDRPAELRRSA
jgi:hypothetical protein